MIVDKIENADTYVKLSEAIAKALEVLRDKELVEKDDGRYDVDGDNLYYLVQRYMTKPMEQCKLEAHKRYIDIQFVAAGEEIMGYCPVENLDVQTPYNPEKDIVFYKKPENITEVKLDGGMFAVLSPQDAHMPKCQIEGPSEVHKVVVKVKING
jgi:YhcH/YjgK/YiaL family protein